mgnify:CR=1 FL=1
MAYPVHERALTALSGLSGGNAGIGKELPCRPRRSVSQPGGDHVAARRDSAVGSGCLSSGIDYRTRFRLIAAPARWGS